MNEQERIVALEKWIAELRTALISSYCNELSYVNQTDKWDIDANKTHWQQAKERFNNLFPDKPQVDW